MSNRSNSVNSNELADQNRLELLMFSLNSEQKFGINVFKIKEVIQCPTLTQVPNSHPAIRGVMNIRGLTISVIDLSVTVGLEPNNDPASSWVIVTEYSCSIQGFLVSAVDRIINTTWAEIKPPPNGIEMVDHITAVTEIDNELVQVLDVEQVISKIVGIKLKISEEVKDRFQESIHSHHHVLIIDDSLVARKQVISILDKLDVSYDIGKNGHEGLQILENLLEQGESVTDKYSMILCDVEMPTLDGYTFTKTVKDHQLLSSLYICLHTSVNGSFNRTMAKKVGADDLIAKFDPDTLTNTLTSRFEELEAEREMTSV